MVTKGKTESTTLKDGVCIKESGKAWIKEDVVKSWVDVLLPLFSRGQKRALLFWDGTSTHRAKAMKTFLQARKVYQVMIPAGMTGFLQSFDIGTNRPFKQYLREEATIILIIGLNAIAREISLNLYYLKQ